MQKTDEIPVMQDIIAGLLILDKVTDYISLQQVHISSTDLSY